MPNLYAFVRSSKSPSMPLQSLPTLMRANSMNAASHGVTERCAESIAKAPRSVDPIMQYAYCVFEKGHLGIVYVVK